MTKDEVQALLIRSIHSDKDAEGILSAERGKQSVFDIIAEIVETSESGDARMEGAYWLSQFNIEIIKHNEDRLLSLMSCENNSITVHIMIALSKIKSRKALHKIIDERIKPSLPWEALALSNYVSED